MTWTATGRSAATAAGLVVAVLAVAVLAMASPVLAATTALGRSGPQAADSGSWGVTPTSGAAAPATPGPLTLTFIKPAGGATAPPQYFNVVNNRSLDISAATYTLTQSDTTMIAVEACSVAWNETTGACGGTTSVLVTTTTGATTGSATSTVVPAAPGAVLRLKCRPTQVSKNNDTYTIGVQVPRSAVRAGTTTTR